MEHFLFLFICEPLMLSNEPEFPAATRWSLNFLFCLHFLFRSSDSSMRLHGYLDTQTDRWTDLLSQVHYFHCSSLLTSPSENTFCRSGNHLTHLRTESQICMFIIYLFIYSKLFFFSLRCPKKNVRRTDEQDALYLASPGRGSGRARLTGRKVLTAGRWRATLERWNERLSVNQSGEGEEGRWNRKCDAAETLQ